MSNLNNYHGLYEIISKMVKWPKSLATSHQLFFFYFIYMSGCYLGIILFAKYIAYGITILSCHGMISPLYLTMPYLDDGVRRDSCSG